MWFECKVEENEGIPEDIDSLLLFSLKWVTLDDVSSQLVFKELNSATKRDRISILRPGLTYLFMILDTLNFTPRPCDLLKQLSLKVGTEGFSAFEKKFIEPSKIVYKDITIL